jgi:hypothetical protein
MFLIKTDKGYLQGFSEDTYPVKLGNAYQNAELNKPIFSKEPEEYTARGLPSIITSLTNLMKEELIDLKYISIEPLWQKVKNKAK